MKRRISLILIISIIVLSLTSCADNKIDSNEIMSEELTKDTIEEIETKTPEVKDKYYFETKEELFVNYFADFYNYIINERNGKEDLESYGIVSVETLYVFLKIFEGGQGDFPSVGRLLGKYFLRKDIGGSIYDQTPQDGFVGYCLHNNMYVNATLYFQEFFKYFRKEEGVDKKYEHATDFLALPNDSMIDVNKYFYYDTQTLPKFFTNTTMTKKLIDQVPSEGLVEFLLATKSVAVNKTNKKPKETDFFGKSKDTTPIYQVRVADGDEIRLKKIALTFDSGVTIEKTLDLLNVLDMYDIKATFFMTYGAMKDSPEFVLEILNRGHEIGNHSTTHCDFRKTTKMSRRLELFLTHEYIKKLTGQEMNLFRFPYGSYDAECVKEIKEMGYYPIQWSNDSLDWKQEGVEAILQHVYEGVKPHSGTIILFHNGAEFTIEALPFVIEQLKSQGFSFAKVSDLIYLEDFDVKTNMGQQQKLSIAE